MPLTWTRVRDGDHNDRPVYEYHAMCEDRKFHIVWAYDGGGTFGLSATRFSAGRSEYLTKRHGILWLKTLKNCKAWAERINNGEKL